MKDTYQWLNPVTTKYKVSQLFLLLLANLFQEFDQLKEKALRGLEDAGANRDERERSPEYQDNQQYDRDPVPQDRVFKRDYVQHENRSDNSRTNYRPFNTHNNRNTYSSDNNRYNDRLVNTHNTYSNTDNHYSTSNNNDRYYTSSRDNNYSNSDSEKHYDYRYDPALREAFHSVQSEKNPYDNNFGRGSTPRFHPYQNKFEKKVYRTHFVEEDERPRQNKVDRPKYPTSSIILKLRYLSWTSSTLE